MALMALLPVGLSRNIESGPNMLFSNIRAYTVMMPSNPRMAAIIRLSFCLSVRFFLSLAVFSFVIVSTHIIDCVVTAFTAVSVSPM